MLKWLLHRQIAASVERPFGYDAGYFHEVVEADAVTALKFAVVTGLASRRHAPAEAMAAAGLVGTLAEDCGPCTQISVDIALAGGASPEASRAILAGDLAAMGPDAALGYRFATATLARDLEASDAARDEVVARWGKRGPIALAMALTTARMYPTLKYALGHGRTCSRVTVAGEAAPFARPLSLAA